MCEMIGIQVHTQAGALTHTHSHTRAHNLYIEMTFRREEKLSRVSKTAV